jgi:type IV pilus assembly protein PilA
MLRFFNRKLHNRKGFTLIELIVVIAILAILALIAIPRFTGFTNRAKIQADDQYGALVGNTALVLLAANDLTVTSPGAITITGSNGALSFSGVVKRTGSIAPGTDAAEMFANNIQIKPLQYFTQMVVTVDGTNGTYSITSRTNP